MANPNPPEATRWKKGQSGNPTGRRKLPVDLRKIAPVSAEELRRIIAKHLRMKKEQIAEVLMNKNSSSLSLILASTIAKAIKDGDINKAEYLFMRSIGKAKEPNDDDESDLSKLSMSELTKLVKENMQEDK